jgi:hypothetical protein
MVLSEERLEEFTNKKMIYILDTTVLIEDADIIYKLGDSTMVIPLAVIREIDGLKKSKSEWIAQAARKMGRLLDKLSSYGDLASGVNLPTGGLLKVSRSYVEVEGLASEADNKIVGTAIAFKNAGFEVTLLTTDANMRTVTRTYVVKAEYPPFFDGEVPLPNTTSFKTGRTQDHERMCVFAAFNKFFLPLRVKVMIISFLSLTIFLHSKSADWVMSASVATLIMLLTRLVTRIFQRKIKYQTFYAGEDPDQNIIWGLRKKL